MAQRSGRQWFWTLATGDQVRLRLAEARGKLLDAGIDLEALPVVETLPAPSDGGS